MCGDGRYPPPFPNQLERAPPSRQYTPSPTGSSLFSPSRAPAEISGTDVDIVDVAPTGSDLGKIAGCLVGLLSLAVFGMILGLSGGPLAEPLLERTKRWTMPVDDDLSLELDETEVSRRALAWSVIK